MRVCRVWLLVALWAGATSRADDWPQWGGPRRDLVWRESGIVKVLPKPGPGGLLERLWSTPVAEGYAGPAVAAGRVYVMDRIRKAGTERVLCLDAGSGQLLWKREYKAQYTVDYPAGPRMTPLVDGDLVYTLGAMGEMLCLQAADGEIVWRKNFIDDFETSIPTWGMVATPLVDGNRLITLVGGQPGALVVCFDKRTGAELWRALEDSEPGYCPPMLYTFGKTRQVIVWHPHAVSSLRPEDGGVIWQIPFAVKAGLCIPTPRQVENRLFVTAFYNGPLMIEVFDDGRQARVAWKGSSNSEIRTDGLHSIMSTPWVTSTHIFGVCSHGQLRCLDARTGQRLWETREPTGEGRWWNAFIIPHEDRYFLHNEQGDLIIAHLDGQGYRELSRAKLVEPTRQVNERMTIWSHPAFAMQSVFARNDKEIVRVDLKQR